MKECNPPSTVNVSSLRLNSFADAFESDFGFPRAAMFFLLLVECAIRNLSMERLCDRKFKSSDRLFHYMGKMSVEKTTRFCNDMLKRAFKVLLKSRWHWKPVYIAIDFNDVEYHGTDVLMVHDTMKKKGRQFQHVKVLRYATVAIVSRMFKFTLAITPVSRLDKPEDVVKRLLDEVPSILKIKGVLMDKGFYNAYVFMEVDEKNLDYIVPAKKHLNMTLTYRIAEVTDKWYWKYTMNQGKKNQYMTTVYFEEYGMDDYIGMVTNKDMSIRDAKTLFDAYRLRWNIENSYKDSDYYKIKTSSKNHAYRILIYMIRHLLMNMLGLVKRINKTIVTNDNMKLIIELLLTLKHVTLRLTKTHIVIT